MKNPAFSVIEACVALAIISVIVAAFWSVHYRESVLLPEAFAAWEKQTGNEKRLTFDEWRSLVRANEDQNGTIINFTPR